MDYSVLNSIESSVGSLWFDVTRFVPELITALLVVIAGWIIGSFVSGIVRRVFVKLHLDDALDKAGVDELSKRAGYAFRPSHFAGSLVKWFVILAFTIVALDILRLNQVTVFLREVVLGYLPLVFAAVLILFAGLLVAKVAQKLVMGIVRSGGNHSPELFGKIAYGLVIAFAVMAALNQLQIADELVQTLFMGIVFALSLGAGLAFGLGGRDAAGRYIDKMTRGGGHNNHQ